ncbi:MAG: MerR family transcriptional regulator, partial [Acidimicrobiales bacterium]
MSGRSYLSIGDVLSLLRQEFPDVTISKIRFLESQGLVNPERTPSGYRKFYEHDVERLRWVLRQQREHFLPLKVIKDRLDEDGTGAVAAVAPAPAAGAPHPGTRTVVDPVPEPAEEAPTGAEPVLVGHRASPSRSTVEVGTVAGDPTTALP